MKNQAGNIRKGEDLNWNALEDYLSEKLGHSDEMRVQQFHGGHANLSYLLSFGANKYVLRRPPFGKIAPGAHDMFREYRVLSRLHKYYKRAPAAVLYCEDPEIVGSHFVVMEYRDGIIIRKELPQSLASIPNVRSRLSEALIKAQTELHLVDYKEAQLENLGKDEAFLERQFKSWIKRWELLDSHHDSQTLELIQKLADTIPAQRYNSIIHNDFKFDNCIISESNPDNIDTVLDWDMATIGDPLFDFCSSLVYWPDPFFKPYDIPGFLDENFPGKEILKELYWMHSGFSKIDLSWYESFCYFKTAVIALQLYKRFEKGETGDLRMKQFHSISSAFLDRALHLSRML